MRASRPIRWTRISRDALFDARGDIAVTQQPTFVSADTTLLDLAREPFAVVHPHRQQLDGHLIDRASSVCGEAPQLGFEFWWKPVGS